MLFNKGNYEEDTKEFIEITAEEFEEKLAAGEKTIVYLGKAVCPYCRKFVPKLDKVRKEKNLTIHYLDSLNTPTDPAIQSLRDKNGRPYRACACDDRWSGPIYESECRQQPFGRRDYGNSG